MTAKELLEKYETDRGNDSSLEHLGRTIQNIIENATSAELKGSTPSQLVQAYDEKYGVSWTDEDVIETVEELQVEEALASALS